MSDNRQFCTFVIEDRWFGVEVEEVQEVIRYQDITRVPHAPEAVRGLINLRGQIVTAIDLRKRLGLPDPPNGRRPMNVVVRSETGPVSLLVDDIGDVIEVSDESFELAPDTLQRAGRDLIRGAYKLKDRLLLVLEMQKAVQVGTL